MKNTFEQLEPKIIQWGVDRDLYHPEHGATATSQLHKFFEEFGELNQAILKNDLNGIKDAIGDCQVCLIHRAKFLGVKLEMPWIPEESILSQAKGNFSAIDEETLFDIVESAKDSINEAIGMLEITSAIYGFDLFECLNFVYNEIKDRKGKMINRTFVKDE